MLTDEQIRAAFYDPAVGLSSATKLYQKLKKDHPDLTLKQVNDVVSKQQVVQTHGRQKCRNFDCIVLMA